MIEQKAHCAHTHTHTPVSPILRVFKAAKNYSTLLPFSLSHSCWFSGFLHVSTS